MSNNRNMSRNRFGDHTVVVQGSNYAPINSGFPAEDSPWLEKISQENPAYHKSRIFESKGPFLYESFCWVLDNPDFNKWRNTEKSGVFWIKGDPGKGKTMLLGDLVDDFEKSPLVGIDVAYFFCQATDSRINTAAAVIGGLIYSFIKQHHEHHELQSYIRTKYEDDLGKLNGPDRWYILRDIFENVTQHSTLPNPVCVVDALDECEQEHGCKQLLRLIIETSCHVKWLISSRNITEIERELQEIDSHRRLSLELKGNAEYVTKSVGLYIDKSIQNIVALKGDEELFTKATNILKGKANGTFLWVALVIEQLRHTKHRNVEAVLDEIPEGLDNLYNLILKRLAKREDKDAYQVLLTTVTIAERPLRLEELLTFISYQWKCYKTTYTVRDIQDLIKDCGSFLSIRENTVYFIHQSVKDYIMGAASRVVFPSGIEYQHYKMFTASLSAMSRVLKHDIYGVRDPESYRISRPDPDPLAPIEYCCLFWVEHLFQCCESGASRDKIFLKDDRLLHSFLKVKYLCWLESLALLRSLEPQGTDAIQKLKNLLFGYYNSGTNEHRRVQNINLLQKREKGRHQFIHRYKDLYLGTYMDYVYTFFYHYDDSRLRKFIDDAYQFFYNCKDRVSTCPLQLYYSAVAFEDAHSAIYTTFRHIIRAEFKHSPICIKMPPKQASLVQNIELKCRGRITTLLFSPDSSLLCSLSDGGTIALCRTDTCSLERMIEMDMGERADNVFIDRWRHFLAFSADSKHLVSMSSTGNMQEWAVTCGTQVQNFSLDLNTNLVMHLGSSLWNWKAKEIFQEEVIALSDYGHLAASTCRTILGTVSLVKVWTIETRKCICAIDQPQGPGFLHAAFSPNLEMIALICREYTRVYSAQTGQEIEHLIFSDDIGFCWSYSSPETDIRYSRFSSDSKLLVLKYSDNRICLWCTETWTMVRDIIHPSLKGHFDLSPNATGFVFAYGHAVLVAGISIEIAEPLLSIKTHVRVNNPIFSPDWADSSLLASYSDGAVQIWRAYSNVTDISYKIQDHTSYSSDVAISPKSKYVSVFTTRGNIEIWSGESGECMQVLEGNAALCSSPVFSPSSELVACFQDAEGKIQIWNVETGKPLYLLQGPGDRYLLAHTAFSDDSRYIVAGFRTGQVKVWCIESGKCVYNKDTCNTQIFKVAFSPDSRYIATASGDKSPTACIWAWRTDQCVFQTQLQRASIPQIFAFSSDATVFVNIVKLAKSALSEHAYKAEFYDIASGTCLSHIDIGSYDWPFFDSVRDHIVSSNYRFCKRSSWSHWDIIPRAEYSHSSTSAFARMHAPGPLSNAAHSRLSTFSFAHADDWICFGGRKVSKIPRRLSAKKIRISDSLLVIETTLRELYIIQLPSR